MTPRDLIAPQLSPMSQCNGSLDFSPTAAWPESLPAVAIHGWVIAGFQRDLVFNHLLELKLAEPIAKLFCSLHRDLSFVEMARLMQKLSQKVAATFWFPVAEVAELYHWNFNEQFSQMAKAVMATPVEFQNWCVEKKVGPQDLAPLLSASDIDLSFFYDDLKRLSLSKSFGVKALELVVELILMGQKPENLKAERLLTFLGQNQSAGEAWLEALKQLRYPETFKRDLKFNQQMKSIQWPAGTSQARWTRQGDRGGIELKLFVSQPSDLKKAMQSLKKVQDLMETAIALPSDEPETEH